MGSLSNFKDAAPFAAMVFVECGEVGLTILTKAAMNDGISNFVYIVYYNALGILILLPYFIFHCCRKEGPPLTFALLCRFFLLGFFGKCLVMFGYVGIDYSSAALAAALANLTPIFTFLVAIIFRMEKIDLRRPSSQAKSLGTILTVLGAFTVILYRGPAISSIKSQSGENRWQFLSWQSRWVLGGLFLAVTYLFNAIWNVLQAQTVEMYRDKVTVVFFFVLFGTMQCAIFSAVVERNANAWIVHHSIEMIAIVYSAVFGTAIRYSVITWCLHKRGPLYVALFKPLGMIIAELAEIIFLGEIFHLGSVIGAIIIAVGFYTVMWGKAREAIVLDNVCISDSSSPNTPLLQNHGLQEI